MTRAQLAAVHVGGEAAAWSALGFAVDADGVIALANGALAVGSLPGLAVAPKSVPAVVPTDVEGVPVFAGAVVAAATHPNGAVELDHLVLITDSLDRTSAVVAERLALPQRRVREAGEGERRVRQAFHRFAPAASGARGCIVEIVESSRTQGPTALFGVVVIVADLEALCADLGPDLIGPPKPAVQPRRQIATVRSAAALGLPVALMSPGRDD